MLIGCFRVKLKANWTPSEMRDSPLGPDTEDAWRWNILLVEQ